MLTYEHKMSNFRVAYHYKTRRQFMVVKQLLVTLIKFADNLGLFDSVLIKKQPVGLFQ